MQLQKHPKYTKYTIIHKYIKNVKNNTQILYTRIYTKKTKILKHNIIIIIYTITQKYTNTKTTQKYQTITKT